MANNNLPLVKTTITENPKLAQALHSAFNNAYDALQCQLHNIVQRRYLYENQEPDPEAITAIQDNITDIMESVMDWPSLDQDPTEAILDWILP